MPARTAATAATAAAAAAMMRNCIFVQMRTATQYECCLTRWNAACRVAPKQNTQRAVQREERLDLCLSQLMTIEARVLKYKSVKWWKVTMIGHNTWLMLCMPSAVQRYDFRWLCFLLWDRKLLTVGYVNKLYALVESPSQFSMRVVLGWKSKPLIVETSLLWEGWIRFESECSERWMREPESIPGPSTLLWKAQSFLLQSRHRIQILASQYSSFVPA